MGGEGGWLARPGLRESPENEETPCLARRNLQLEPEEVRLRGAAAGPATAATASPLKEGSLPGGHVKRNGILTLDDMSLSRAIMNNGLFWIS